MKEILKKLDAQMKILGYEKKEADNETLNYLILRYISEIKRICSVEEIEEPLEYVIVDKVCAQFLKGKIALNENIGISVSSAKRVQIGDVTVDFPDNSSNQEKLELILDKLERKDFDYSPYAKMGW